MKFVSVVLCAFVLACGGGGSKPPTTPPASTNSLVLVDEAGIAVGGNDPIAYTTGEVTPGTDEFKSTHGGATYQFVSPDNKTKFDAEPAKYVPGYGGYCAYAASQNRLSESDPTVYLMHEGQLLLFTNDEFLELFKKDPAGNKTLADKNWPGLVAKHGKP